MANENGMDPIVRKAMAKWPNVPALFGWLGLDRRGRWLLQGRPIERRPLIDFIGRNYLADEHGRWFFQNGPQRVFIELAYTPWVLRVTGQGGLETHTGVPVDRLLRAWLDEDGSLLLEWSRGVALLDDADLDWALEQLRDASGAQLDEQTLAAALTDGQALDAAHISLSYGPEPVPLGSIQRSDVPVRFEYSLVPQPHDGERVTF